MRISFGWAVAILVLIFTGVGTVQGVEETSQKSAKPLSEAQLATLKSEWEAVRDEQVQMIREKQDQLEKLKEEIFSKMKSPGGSSLSEAQKAALEAERQKIAAEMNSQKENLRQLQVALDEKTRQLQIERDRFEQEKLKAVR
ncbi:MAG: hypothetical protein V1882_12640 [Candidatus Omnitrophota bacterium]